LLNLIPIIERVSGGVDVQITSPSTVIILPILVSILIIILDFGGRILSEIIDIPFGEKSWVIPSWIGSSAPNFTFSPIRILESDLLSLMDMFL